MPVSISFALCCVTRYGMCVIFYVFFTDPPLALLNQRVKMF